MPTAACRWPLCRRLLARPRFLRSTWRAWTHRGARQGKPLHPSRLTTAIDHKGALSSCSVPFFLSLSLSPSRSLLHEGHLCVTRRASTSVQCPCFPKSRRRGEKRGGETCCNHHEQRTSSRSFPPLHFQPVSHAPRARRSPACRQAAAPFRSGERAWLWFCCCPGAPKWPPGPLQRLCPHPDPDDIRCLLLSSACRLQDRQCKPGPPPRWPLPHVEKNLALFRKCTPLASFDRSRTYD